ncbi:MAG: YicC family protein [Ruminobacter sp.]|uniref:YicC/YloC family endoribonuclease n=1 Tax=Ruminobacter sp. TaxID=2774296 RepID=UPI001B4B94C0|nr:YicC/YloC family endoribonuclease [Ruminobacter sp.]MBP3749099.1 YicC family protein [Ruminobacter sp.]
MIHSMTGFASVSNQNDAYITEVNIKTVNSRFMEISLRIPEILRIYEMEVRNCFKDFFNRGKFEISISLKNKITQNALEVNNDLVEALTAKVFEINNAYRQKDPDAKCCFSANDILMYPGVITDKTGGSDDLQELVFGSVKECMKKLNESRALEGEKIKNFLNGHLSAIESLRKNIIDRMPEIVDWQKSKVSDFIKQHQVKVDDSLLEQEIILLCQRMDIAEELNRLSSHIEQAKHILNQGGICGKRLDFLMQEFNRETNTIASKSINTEITNSAIELKVQIEQMREQVQNIE